MLPFQETTQTTPATDTALDIATISMEKDKEVNNVTSKISVSDSLNLSGHYNAN